MQVKSIAECSNGSILQYFRPALSDNRSLRPLTSVFKTFVLSIFAWSFYTGGVRVLYNSFQRIFLLNYVNFLFFLFFSHSKVMLDLTFANCYMKKMKIMVNAETCSLPVLAHVLDTNIE